MIEFLWLRYSRQRGASRDIVATLAEALAKSRIHNKNTTRARDSLTHALRHLMERGLVERHTELPRARSGSFVATLCLPPAYGRTDADLSLGEDATGNPGMLVQKGMRTDAGQGDRDEVSGVQGDKEPDRAHASIVYQRVVVFQGTLRSAEHVWRLIYDRAQQQLSPAIKSHLSSVYPEWRVERLSGGAEGLYTLCLGITPALFHRLHGELPALQAFADAMWPGVIALEFTPRRPLP